jgi:NADPH:quinone reductase-like Zn-dependent oxidoreductase
LTRSLTLRGFWLNEWLSRTPLELQRNAVTSILADMAAGALRAPDVEATYDLAAVHEAVAHAERSREGKILLSG